jgi:hypothetical protein
LNASSGGRTDIVERILQFETKPDQDVINEAIWCASEYGYSAIVECLSQHVTE